jgi:hypothetical protein
MASALHDKTTSYTHDRGIEFSEAYTLTPTRTGTASLGTWTNVTATAPPVGNIDGPSNGQSCWEFQNSNTGTNNTFFRSTASAERTPYGDADYVWSTWIKFDNLPATASNQGLRFAAVTSPAGGFILWLAGSSNSESGFTGSKFTVVTGSASPTTNVGNTQIYANKWYMVSIRRNGSGSNNYSLYVNGALDKTWTNTETSAASTVEFGTSLNNTGTGLIKYRFSNFVLGSNAIFTNAVLQEIYNVGKFGYGKALEDLGISPTHYFKFDDTASLDIIANYGTTTTSVNLSSTPTYISYPDGKSKAAINLTPYGGYDSGPSGLYGTTNTIAFWFKRPSPPASQTQWMYLFYDSTAKIDTSDKAGINTDGTIRFAPTIDSQNLSALVSSTNICDNQWHHVAITRNGVNAKLYIDGSLQSSTSSWNSFAISSTASYQPFGGLGNYFDEVTIFNSNELSGAQIAALYASSVSSTNASYTATVALATNSEFPMPTVTAQSSVSVTYNSEAFGGNLNSATMVEPLLSINVNLDAPGVSIASCDFILPVTTTTASVEIFAVVALANADTVMPVISAQKYVNYSAAPATASALFSSNVYYGQTLQDTSYSLTLRSIGATTNTSANGGFSIGATRDNNIVSQTSSLAIKANSGFPVFNKLVKVKFDPSHVTAITSGDYSPSNYFDVYVFTANPSTTFDTMNFGNLPAKEFVFTTRLIDDGSANQTYLDLTSAFADSRSATYGVYIELNTAAVGGTPSGTYYDRTEWTGSNLQNHLLYVLTSDIVNKNINADIITANAEFAMPVIEAQKYVNALVDPSTSTSNAVHPVIYTEQGNIYMSGTLDASANAVQPTFNATVQYTSDHLNAFADISNPTLYITGTVNYSATPATANALFHMPQFDIGENNSADHMNATALMVNPSLLINSSVPAMLATVSGTMVNPTIGAQLLGTIYANPMTGSARMTVLANDSSLASDLWYNRLYQQDYVSLANEGFVGFMLPYYLSGTGNLATGSTIRHSGYEPSGPAYATSIAGLNTNLTPAPIGIQGFYDNWNRRSIKFTNIAYRWRDPLAGSETLIRSVDRGYTMETMIKTTKSNQVLFVGQNGYTFTANIIGLKNGKVYIKQSIDNTLFITDSRINNTTKTTTLMQAANTNLADGEWHHLIIQFGFDGRHQIWIDGELELQRYGYTTMLPNIIGYNSADSNLNSEFEISGIAIQSQQFLLEKEVQLNYFAAINYAPIEVEPMTASVNITQGTTAKGNRGRALMLYFWSTYGIDNNNYFGGSGSVPGASLQRNTSFDQLSDSFDYDTSANLSTWELEGTGTQQWKGWDIFPVDVQGIYASSVVKPESYKNLTTATYFTGQNPISWKQSEGFYDETTDNRRYIDLMKDIPNLEDFDMIFFRNYPDQGTELESFTKYESVDTYFKLQEKTLFENFIKSLRDAVDTGISLLVTNPQLAIDLGIIDRVEIVSDMDTQLASRNDIYADNRVQETSNWNGFVNTDPGREDTLFYFSDSYKNNRHRLVYEVEDLTTIPGYIWKEHAYYHNDGAREFAGVDRWWNKYDYHTSIPVGEEFLIATYNPNVGEVKYQAVPFANIKAGKAMTAFGTTINQNGVDIPNPYANYATSIVVEPGDNLNGRQVGGKIFVSFTETIQKVGNYDVPKEYGQIGLVTDAAIEYAYSQGAITSAQRTSYLNSPNNFDRLLESGEMSQTDYNKLTYWDDDGKYIIAAVNYGNTQETTEQGNPRVTGERNTPLNKYALKPNQSTVSNFSTSGPWFTLSWGYEIGRVNIWVPSINVRAFSWLYNREFLMGRNQDHVAQRATAVMVQPTVTANKENFVNVQAMIANATITQGDYSDSRSVVALPFEANATITQFVKNIKALPMTASATLRTQISVLTSSIDEVILYVYHEDPVLYLREEVIK